MLTGALLFAGLQHQWPQVPWSVVEMGGAVYDVETYGISGQSLIALAASINQDTPLPGAIAEIRARMEVWYDLVSTTDGQCQFANQRIDVIAEFTYPEPDAPLRADLQREWHAAIDELVDHELQHLTNWIEAAEQIWGTLGWSGAILPCADLQEWIEYDLAGAKRSIRYLNGTIDATTPHRSRLLRCVQALALDPGLEECPA